MRIGQDLHARDEVIWRDRKLRSSPTIMQWAVDVGVEDYQRKQIKKAGLLGTLPLYTCSVALSSNLRNPSKWRKPRII